MVRISRLAFLIVCLPCYAMGIAHSSSNALRRVILDPSNIPPAEPCTANTSPSPSPAGSPLGSNNNVCQMNGGLSSGKGKRLRRTVSVRQNLVETDFFWAFDKEDDVEQQSPTLTPRTDRYTGLRTRRAGPFETRRRQNHEYKPEFDASGKVYTKLQLGLYPEFQS